jgi:hypothetical protein
MVHQERLRLFGGLMRLLKINLIKEKAKKKKKKKILNN